MTIKTIDTENVTDDLMAIFDFMESNRAARQLIKAVLEAAPEVEPDQFWLRDDPENSYACDLNDLINQHADNCINDPKDFIGYEFRVMRSVMLPDITVKITGYTTGDDGDWTGWEWEAK